MYAYINENVEHNHLSGISRNLLKGIFLFEPHFQYFKLRYRNLFNIINLD